MTTRTKLIFTALILIALFLMAGVASRAQSPKSTALDTKPAKPLALSVDEWREIEPLITQTNVKGSLLKRAAEDMKALDVTSPSSGGDARAAILVWQHAIEQFEEAQKAVQAVMGKIQTAHDCPKCDLDLQKRELVKPAEESKPAPSK